MTALQIRDDYLDQKIHKKTAIANLCLEHTPGKLADMLITMWSLEKLWLKEDGDERLEKTALTKRDASLQQGKEETSPTEAPPRGTTQRHIGTIMGAIKNYLTDDPSRLHMKKVLNACGADPLDAQHFTDWLSGWQREATQKTQAPPQSAPQGWLELLETARALYMNRGIEMSAVLEILDPDRTNSAVICDLTGAWEAEREDRIWMPAKREDAHTTPEGDGND